MASIKNLRYEDGNTSLLTNLNNNFTHVNSDLVAVDAIKTKYNLSTDGKIILEEITYNDTYFDDLRFPAQKTQQGANNLPNYDYTNLGLLFPQNDTSEIAYYIAQFPHNRKNGSDIYPHIHFIQTTDQKPVFKMEYRWYKNGEVPPATWTTIATDSMEFDFTDSSGGDDILQIASFPTIDGSNIDTVSSVMDIKIYRDDNIVTGDVLVKEFDIHYEIDSPGSRDEFTK